jgi:hypothetical protein
MSICKNHLVSCCSFCLFLLLTLLTACSTSSPTPSPPAAQNPTPTLSPTITGTTALGRKNCQPASPIDNASVDDVSLGPEVQGTATNAELWALLQSTSGVPPQANSLVKIVWRMSGSGDFIIVALGPSGMKVSPSQGPNAHLGSNWNRPGDEWGTVFYFPVAGCWDLHATRGTSAGDVWLVVQ